MSLDRRTVLRGAGISLSLPLLDAMIPFAYAQPTITPRAVFAYVPHGVILDEWNYDGILKPLELHKSDVSIYRGMKLNTANTAGSGHATSSATWLSGAVAKDTAGADVSAGKTIDTMIADAIRGDTVLPSMQIGIEDISHMVGACDGTSSCAYINTISWQTDVNPLPMEINPRTLFERMFGYGSTAEERIQRTSIDGSLLDSILESANRMRGKLGNSDANRLENYLDSVRAVEININNLEKKLKDSGSNLSVAPVEIPELYENHVNIMTDIIHLGIQSDTSRVYSFMLSRELNQRTYPQIGVPEQHHGVSHHGYNPERQALHALINTYHVMLMTRLVDKLKNSEDIDGSLLDNTMIMYGAGMGDGNVHSKDPLSNLIIGGRNLGFVGGRDVDTTLEDGNSMPNTNLLLGVLSKFGIEKDSLGHSTGFYT
jgi:hypothetical protein